MTDHPLKRLFAPVTRALSTAGTLVGVRTSPEPKYQLLADHGDIQLRAYPALIVAETVVASDYEAAGKTGFYRLAGYIFGGNRQQQQMAMTTPVFREATGEKIAMTAPVLQQAQQDAWTLAFVMPATYTLDSLPLPLDPLVTLKQIPAKKVAVLRYSGRLTPATIQENSQRLLDWLQQQSLYPVSIPRSAAYDPPWTLPALRRNEIHVDIA